LAILFIDKKFRRRADATFVFLSQGKSWFRVEGRDQTMKGKRYVTEKKSAFPVRPPRALSLSSARSVAKKTEPWGKFYKRWRTEE